MSSASWFARKLAEKSGQPPQQQRQLPPTAQPNYTPPAQPMPQQHNPHGPKPENMTQALAQGYTPNATGKAGETGRCPECFSNNFFASSMARHNAAPHCYDCGYNGLYTQGVGG